MTRTKKFLPQSTTSDGYRRGGSVFVGSLTIMRMVSGQERFYDYINHDGTVKFWVGFGWISSPSEHPSLRTLPVVVDDEKAATWPSYTQAKTKPLAATEVVGKVGKAITKRTR